MSSLACFIIPIHHLRHCYMESLLIESSSTTDVTFTPEVTALTLLLRWHLRSLGLLASMSACAPRLGYRTRYTSGMTRHIWEVEYRGHQQRVLSGERRRHGLRVVAGRSVYKTRFSKIWRARRILMPMTGFLSLESETVCCGR